MLMRRTAGSATRARCLLRLWPGHDIHASRLRRLHRSLPSPSVPLTTPPPSGLPSLDDSLAALRSRFVEASATMVAGFGALADQLQRAPGAPDVLASLRRELHRVSGTAGSYGFHEAGRLAAAFELVVGRWIEDLTLDLTRRGATTRQFARLLGLAFGARAGAGEAMLPGRLLLVELDDETAAPLVSEALARGRFVERVAGAVAQTLIDARAPEGVVAAADVLLTVPSSAAHVLLRGATQEPAEHGPTARVLDRWAGAPAVFNAIEAQLAPAALTGATMLAGVGADAGAWDALSALAARDGLTLVRHELEANLGAALEAHRPAALVLTAWEGGFDGIAAVRRVREDDRFGDLPIILLGADGDVETRRRAFAAGADDLQSTPVVEVELGRRLGRLLEIRRHRLVSRSLHPVSTLTLPERTMRDFEEGLRVGAALYQHMTLAVLRPVALPEDRAGMSAWQRECMLVAAALGVDGARSGFLDQTALGLLLPLPADEVEPRIAGFAEAAVGSPVAWCAGLAEQAPGADVALMQVVQLAEEAWLVARDERTLVHRWQNSDVGVAPDVIIVEDDPALADLIAYAVATRGLTHVKYANGPAAMSGLLGMRTYRRQPIVLMDIDLPGLDGFSLFERIQLERPGAFKVVFMSVRSTEADQLRALRAGAIDYLPKPLSLRVLLAKVAVWRGQGTSR